MYPEMCSAMHDNRQKSQADFSPAGQDECTRHDSDVPLYWKIIVRELRELAWNVGRRTADE